MLFVWPQGTEEKALRREGLHELRVWVPVQKWDCVQLWGLVGKYVQAAAWPLTMGGKSPQVSHTGGQEES